MNIYFVRHGETEANTTNAIQGANDPLTEKGLEQGNLLADRLKKIPFDVILASPLPRTLDTVHIISKKAEASIEVSDLLIEKKNATKLVGLGAKDPLVLEANVQRKEGKLADPEWRYEDEEVFSEIKQRALDALELISSKKAENILVVSHGHILRFMLSGMIFGNEFTEEEHKKIYSTFQLSNVGISLCTFTPAIEEKAGRWRVVSWNDQAHIEDVTI